MARRGFSRETFREMRTGRVEDEDKKEEEEKVVNERAETEIDKLIKRLEDK